MTMDRAYDRTAAGRAGTNRATVVGVFEDRRRAEEAVGELERVGFGADQIGFAVRDSSYADSAASSGERTGGHVYERRPGDGGDVTTDTGPGSGALTGAATGGVLGGIIAAGAALAVPGVGPAIAAGILGPLLGSAAAGAAVGAAGGGMLGGLVTTGVSEDEARYYDEEFRAGRAIVTVRAGDRADEAQRILHDHGAYDVDSRGSSDRSYSAGTATQDAGSQGTVRVPEVEERLDVQKRDTQTGEVRIHKTVETEQRTVPIELEHEEVHVEHRDVDARPLGEGDALGAFEEGTIRVPIRGEEAIVRKEAVVTGEVVVNKERAVERQEITDTVRRQHVEVDEDYNRNRDAFRQHFDSLNAGPFAGARAGRSWEDAEPNYRHGWRAGRDQRYQGRRFEDVEPDLRTSLGHRDTDDRWQQLRDEIREGFDRARR